MNRLIALAGAALLAMGLLALLATQFSVTTSPPTAVMAAKTTPPASHGHFARDEDAAIDPTLIHRDSSGQFRVDARVNGTESRFLVDTGADMVVMTVASAQEAGVPVDPASFQPIAKTASGEGRGARYRVQDFEVAGRTYHNVDVAVIEGLETNLLGQNLLSRIGGVSMQGDAMVLGKAE